MIIELTKNKKALISSEDFERVAKHSWCASSNGNGKIYGQSRIGTKAVFLHRFITGAAKGDFVDHINGNTLDNRRSNLRICTKAQNAQNQKTRINKRHSKLKGVTYDVNRKKWMTQITVNKVKHHLGRFNTEKEAHEAYVAAGKKLHGEFFKP